MILVGLSPNLINVSPTISIGFTQPLFVDSNYTYPQQKHYLDF